MPTRIITGDRSGSRIYTVGRVGYDSIADDAGGTFSANLRTERFSPAGEGGLVMFRRVQARIWHTGAFSGAMRVYVDGVQTQAYNISRVANGNMNSSGSWTLGSNWRVDNANSGVADQSTPTASDISQALSPVMVEGRSYEITYTIASRTAGTLTPKVGQTSGIARSTNDTFVETVVAGSGDALLAFSASATWDGTLDDVSIIELDGGLVDQWMDFEVSAPTEVGKDGGVETIIEMDISEDGTYIEVEMSVDSDNVAGIFLPETFWVGHRVIRPGLQRSASSN